MTMKFVQVFGKTQGKTEWKEKKPKAYLMCMFDRGKKRVTDEKRVGARIIGIEKQIARYFMILLTSISNLLR